MDGGSNLLDLRFADDILILARSRHEFEQLTSSALNADKTLMPEAHNLASGCVACRGPQGRNCRMLIGNITCSKNRNVSTQIVGSYWTKASFPFHHS